MAIDKKFIIDSRIHPQIFLTAVFFILFIIASTTLQVFAEENNDKNLSGIKQKIESKNTALNKLEGEIKQFEMELEKAENTAQTLAGAVKRFKISIKKLNAEIGLTENDIAETKKRINFLKDDIADKERRIKQNIKALGETIRRIREAEEVTLVEIVLSNSDFSEAMDETERIKKFQRIMQSDLSSLRALKENLSKLVKETEKKQTKLLGLMTQLEDQRRIMAYQKREKEELLRVTKNKEESYQERLKEKRAQKEAFERELLALEEALQIAIDPDRIPVPAPGVLAFPLDKIKITQNFGNTPFSRANPGVYKGVGHNGVDFRASVGTPVKSALSGFVKGVGNTDEVRGCYSYGKWILVEHANGLSTLYAHLSLIKVKIGEEVGTGAIIGYSGNTGYSTGPHLHFTVYATQGVRIQKFEKSINCKNTFIPIADLKAYLNPRSYLPELPL